MYQLRVYANGSAQYGLLNFTCALGRRGVKQQKQEGDGATPIGCWPIRRVYYRPDVYTNGLETTLPVVKILHDDIWCDDSKCTEYNTIIHEPSLAQLAASHEKMWRHDHVYNIVVELGYNDDPPIPGLGSAIFIHLAREGYTATEGCIAFSEFDLLQLIKILEPGSMCCISS